MKLIIGILALDIVLYNSYDFYSDQMRTLVAMATYCFHITDMNYNLEISTVSLWIIEFNFYRNVY